MQTLILINHKNKYNMSHKLQIKGSIALIHAVSAFVIDWQKKNGKEDYVTKKDSFVDAASAAEPEALPAHSLQFNPAAAVAPETATPVEEKKKRASRTKPKEETTTAPAAAETPDIALPDWLKTPGAPAADTSVQPWLNSPEPAVAPTPEPAQPWAPPVAASQPWSPQIAAAPAPAPVVPGLSQIVGLLQTLGNDEAKRNTAQQFLAYMGYSSADQLPAESYPYVIDNLTKILSGQI